jgi:hypothetical protein
MSAITSEICIYLSSYMQAFLVLAATRGGGVSMVKDQSAALIKQSFWAFLSIS